MDKFYLQCKTPDCKGDTIVLIDVTNREIIFKCDKCGVSDSCSLERVPLEEIKPIRKEP